MYAFGVLHKYFLQMSALNLGNIFSVNDHSLVFRYIGIRKMDHHIILFQCRLQLFHIDICYRALGIDRNGCRVANRLSR